MLRFLFRIAGLLTLAAGFVALVVDGTRSIAAGTLLLTPFGELLTSKLPVIQQAVVRNVHPLLWDPVATGLLRLPIWLVLALGGLFLLWVTRRRAPIIGYTSRP
jgi:hypothetical protein